MERIRDIRLRRRSGSGAGAASAASATPDSSQPSPAERSDVSGGGGGGGGEQGWGDWPQDAPNRPVTVRDSARDAGAAGHMGMGMGGGPQGFNADSAFKEARRNLDMVTHKV